MPWSDLANAYLKQNKLQETIATFEKTLQCNPPAAEKIAIQRDIADIKKILRSRGELPEPNAGKPGSDKKPNLSPNAKQIKTVKQIPAVSKPVQGMAKEAPQPPSPIKSVPSTEHKNQPAPKAPDSDKSGWDYLSK